VGGELLGEFGQRPQGGAERLERRVVAGDLWVRDGDERVGGVDDALAVGVGHADHVRDRHQRQLLGDELDEVPAARRDPPPRTMRPRVVADAVLDALDWRGVNALETQAAQLGVPWRRPWPGTTARPRASPAARRRTGRPGRSRRSAGRGDGADVLVAHDRPVAALVALGDPEDVLGG